MATANWNQFDDLDENVSKSNSPNSFLLQLESVTQLMLQDEYRSSIPENVLLKILHIIEKEECSLETIQCFRLLRNSVAHNWQQFPESWMLIFNRSLHLNNNYFDRIESNEKFLELCRISLQFIANVLNSQPIYLNTWMKLKHNFSSLISHKDEKINLFASSILYNIMKNCADIKKEVMLSEHWKQLINSIIQTSHKGIVFSQLLVQLFLQEPHLSEMYKHFNDLEIRLLFLHQMSEFMTSDCDMNAQNWSFLSQLFQDRAGIILRTCDSPIMDLEAVEVSSLVELLAKGSSKDDCRKQLHISESLAIFTIELLQAMHQLGKSKNNYFTILNDHFASVEEHPALNFKCNLIRLIGNLCYQNVNVQDRLRQSECILPLLECCNLDARNPFIQQWAILTIRNFCENNPVNQQLINSLTQQGVVKPH